MITLLIDTSSIDVSIAILKDNNVINSKTRILPNQHSIYTVEYIDEVLKEIKLTPKNIDQIMVVIGPGSFTGLRIGVTIAKVFAYLEKIRVIGISSLKMRALSIEHDTCMSLIDAHHNNYYMALYNKDNDEIVKEKFTTKEEVLKLINDYHPIIVSDLDGIIDNITYKKQELDFSKIVSYYQNKTSTNPHLLNPNYLKKPQAQEEKK